MSLFLQLFSNNTGAFSVSMVRASKITKSTRNDVFVPGGGGGVARLFDLIVMLGYGDETLLINLLLRKSLKIFW